jgi:hypothetical protein
LTVFEYKKNTTNNSPSSKIQNVNITKTKRKLSVSNDTEIFGTLEEIDFDFNSIQAKPISTSSTILRLTSPKIEEISKPKGENFLQLTNTSSKENKSVHSVTLELQEIFMEP